TSVCLSDDGQMALSGSADKTLKLWDLASGHCLQTLQGHTNWVRAASLSADKQYALSAGGDGQIKLWELAAASGRTDCESVPRCLSSFSGHGGPVLCLAWSRDRRLALSGGSDRTLKLWDVISGECLRT